MGSRGARIEIVRRDGQDEHHAIFEVLAGSKNRTLELITYYIKTQGG